jgi:hypothetical protein
MNVHVSLHPAITSPVENTKANESVATGTSFSHALSAASETTTYASRETSEHGGDKKWQKKGENTKDASATKASIISPYAPPLLPSHVVHPNPVFRQTGDEPVNDQGGKAEDGIAPGSLSSDSATQNTMHSVTSAGGTSSAPGAVEDQGSEGADPIAKQDDATSEPKSGDPAVASNAIPGASVQTPTPAPAIDPSTLLVTAPAVASSATSVPADQGINRAVKATNDDAQVALAAMLPASPFQPTPASALNGANETASVGRASTDGLSKTSSAIGKDRTVSEPRNRTKSGDSKSDGDKDAASPLPAAKPSEIPAALSQQSNGGQQDKAEAQALQAMQVAGQPVNQPQGPSHVDVARPSPEAPVQQSPASVAAGVVEVAATPTLSGARLIQSVHQAEMKLGMNSAEFGNISISTSVTHQALSAQISLDHSELSRVLAAHLPAMEERLGNAYGLQARVEVRDGGTAGQSSTSQQSGDGRQKQQRSGGAGASSSALSGAAARTTSILAADASRLDIRI